MAKSSGQITLFIILGIVVLTILILLISSYKTEIKPEAYTLPQEVKEVEIGIQDCIKEELKRAITITAMQGGYYNLSENFINYHLEEFYLSHKIPYYLIESEWLMPSVEETAKEISSAMLGPIISCTNFSNTPYKAEYSFNEMADTKIKEEYISYNPPSIKIRFNNSVYAIDSFEVEIPTTYLSFHMLSKELTEQQKEYSDKICINCINELSYKYNITIYTIEMIEPEKEDYIIIYYLKKDDVDKEPVKLYAFAHKFKLGGE